MCKLLIKRFQLWHQYPAGQIIFFKKSSKIQHDIFGNVISVEGVGGLGEKTLLQTQEKLKGSFDPIGTSPSS